MAFSLKRYRVLVEVEPLLLRDVDSGEVRPLGGFTTRFERAPDPSKAAEIAITKVEREVRSRGFLNEEDNPARFKAVEIDEVSPFSFNQLAGFTFYPYDPDAKGGELEVWAV